MKKYVIKLITILLLAIIPLVMGELQLPNHCPKWTIPNKNGTDCVCGDPLDGVVKCDPNTLESSIAICHCMAFSNIYNKTLVGNCLFSCNIGTLPGHIYFSADHQCSTNIQLHRDGQNCGKCEHGHAPSVYSYNLFCVKCDKYKYNWLKYIAVAFIPLTVFYIIVILFRINVASGSMNVFILVSQCVAAPGHLRLFSAHIPKLNDVGFSLFTSLYGIWNLDFFRSLYHPFCLHPNITTLETFALEYAVAVYPLLLIVITYVFVKLHDHYSMVVWLWRPFYWCFARIRREWNIHSSLIGAFATFLLLSYVKIANISFDLLTPVALYDVQGNKMSQLFLYYDGTHEYFGKKHLPYAFLALFMFLVFNIFPLFLLTLYPSRYFQRFLNYFEISREPLRVFIETFNGCYKLKPNNCQYFASFYLFLRIVNLALFALTTTPLYYPLTAFMFLCAVFLVASIRPYKVLAFNVLDTIIFGLLSMSAFMIPAWGYLSLLDPQNVKPWWCHAVWIILLLTTPLYGLCLVIYNLIPQSLSLWLNEFIKQHKKRNETEMEFPRPYRLDHSDEYQPLL